MSNVKRILVSCALLGAILVSCGGGDTTGTTGQGGAIDSSTTEPINAPQSASPTTDVPQPEESAIATARAEASTAVSQQVTATSQTSQ